MDTLVDKFNEILEEILSARQGHFILDPNPKMLGVANFLTMHGQLSGYGKVKYWCEIDKIIEKFDTYEVSLRHISSAEKDKSRKKIEDRM